MGKRSLSHILTNVLGEVTTVANANLEDVLSELDGEIIGGSALTV